VKRNPRIVPVILLTALYSFALGLSAGASVLSSQPMREGTKQAQRAAVIADFCLGDPLQVEALGDAFDLSFSTADSDAHFVLAAALSSDKCYTPLFSRYRHQSEVFLLLLFKSQLIFPFHYFW